MIGGASSRTLSLASMDTTEHDHDAEEREVAASVVADAVSIYEGGKLTAVSITELLNNEVAVRQLINDYNQTKRDNQELENEIERLKLNVLVSHYSLRSSQPTPASRSWVPC